jgi:hypothetical protein
VIFPFFKLHWLIKINLAAGFEMAAIGNMAGEALNLI